MADCLQVTFRPLAVEDFGGPSGLQGAPAAGPGVTPILGAGLSPVTPFVAAPDAPSAVAAGVPLGGLYIATPGGTAPIFLAIVLPGSGGIPPPLAAQPAPGGWGDVPGGNTPMGGF